MMEEFASETDSEYTSYWRDWVGTLTFISVNQPASPVHSPQRDAAFSGPFLWVFAART